MKFSFALFFSAVAGASALKKVPTNAAIKADTELGQKLMSKARRLEEEEEQDAEEFTWVAGYSLKFQGCHHVQQWNGEADEDEDVKIATKRLVRFRLCPNETCSASKAAGCTGGYGDYVIDMNTYVNAYYEAKRQSEESACENYLNYNCDCDDDDGKDDGFDRDYCEYDCYIDGGMDYCVDRNPYEDDEQAAEEFNLEEYMECAQLDVQQDEGERKLEEGDEADEDALYIGPYCAEQGGSIYLGVFSDDACSVFADDYGGKTTFYELTGTNLPFGEESIVGMECVSCTEVEDDGDDEQDAADEDRVSETCEQIYANAGKCETNLPSGMTDELNTNACTYIEGIKITRADGLISTSAARKSPVARAFIVIFAMLFLALGYYVWYLRKRLGVRNNSLM